MIRISLTPNQLATASFAISPLMQLVTAIGAFRSPGPDPAPWFAERWERVPPASRALLEHLVDPATRYLPDFLMPVPATARPRLADELEAVRTTSAGRVRIDLGRFLRLGEAPHGYAAALGVGPEVVDGWRAEPTELDRAVWAGDDTALATLTAGTADALEEAWHRIIEPSWALARATLEADVMHRMRQASVHGVQETVLAAVGRTRRDGTFVEVSSSLSLDVSVRTGRVVLLPGIMLEHTPGLAVLSGNAREDLVLGYPCRGHGVLTGPHASGAGAETDTGTLGAALGNTRLRLLEHLLEPSSGRALAARLGLSPATVSYHLSLLHRSGMVERTRSGREVCYSLTPSGRTRLAAPPESVAAGEWPDPGFLRVQGRYI